MKEVRTVIFAKAPRPGEVKTRLIPALGAKGAARLARRLIAHTLEQALLADIGVVELCRTPDDEAAWRCVAVPANIHRAAQGEGDLGERLARASERVIGSGCAVLLIGTDCPALDASALRRIARSLEAADAVIVPAVDGGYVALALRRSDPRLFTRMDWSTSVVARETSRRLGELGWVTTELPAQHDIDRPADLEWLPAGWPEASFSRSRAAGSEKDRNHR